MTVMDAEDRFTLLASLYAFYDDFVAGMPFACAPGCSTCCTWNVTATSLETSYLSRILGHDRLCQIADLAKRQDAPGWYRPTATINEIAASCLAMRDPPIDSGIHTNGGCPLLDDRGLCLVYARRPFACRAMSSRIRCEPDGEALMDPFLVTVNLAMHQIIEDIDAGNYTGNLIDLLAKEATLGSSPAPFFIKNKPLPGFLVDPALEKEFDAFLFDLCKATGLRYGKDPCRPISPLI